MISEHLSRLDDDRAKWDYICPRCGSNDWKFPNPLMAAEGMINYAGMAQLFYECRSCLHIGIFFKVDITEKIEFERPAPIAKKEITVWQKMILIFVYLVGEIFALGMILALGLAKKFQKK